MKKKQLESNVIRVHQEKKIQLKDIDPDGDLDGISKEKSQTHFLALQQEMCELQERLYAEQKQCLLLIFQAMDTGGKDGAVRSLFTGINPAGVQITSFKAPTVNDLKFDFLKRIHDAVPPKGFIGVWNRSHYEDVLIVKVHRLIDKQTCTERLEDICAFEKMLSRNGTKILKFYLHISSDEQRKRLQERLDNSEKHWKFDPADIEERKLWNEYQAAYETAMNATSTSFAPWYIVPSNHKWIRNVLISSIVVDALKKMDPSYPDVKFDKDKIKIL